MGGGGSFFGKLSCLIIANIARRRTDQAGNRMLFHIFRHIQTDQCLGGIEQIFRKGLNQLGLAHAGRSDK